MLELIPRQILRLYHVSLHLMHKPTKNLQKSERRVNDVNESHESMTGMTWGYSVIGIFSCWAILLSREGPCDLETRIHSEYERI